jgi:hypothetical protein
MRLRPIVRESPSVIRKTTTSAAVHNPNPRWYAGLSLAGQVNDAVTVPRPPTEEMIAMAAIKVGEG